MEEEVEKEGEKSERGGRGRGGRGGKGRGGKGRGGGSVAGKDLGDGSVATKAIWALAGEKFAVAGDDGVVQMKQSTKMPRPIY